MIPARHLAITLILALWLPANALAQATFYTQDDGLAESFVGNPASSVFQSQIGLVHYNSVAGGEWIRSISIAFPDFAPAPAPGDPVNLYLWDDPNLDGDPSDATLLGSWPATIQNATGAVGLPGGVFTEHPIPQTLVGSSFFVGYRYEGIGAAGVNGFLADQTSDSGESWYAETSGGASTDPNNLAAAAPAQVGKNLMIRALGGPEFGFVNGSFETGDFDGWGLSTSTVGIPPNLVAGIRGPTSMALSLSAPTDGAVNVSMGDSGGTTEYHVEFYQDIDLPFDATTVDFDYSFGTIGLGASVATTFDVEVESAGGGGTLQGDNFFTIPPGGVALETFNHPASIDVSAFRGNSIRVLFRVSMGVGIWQFELDNVRLSTSTTQLGLYFDPAYTQDLLLDPPLFTPINAYLVAKGIPSLSGAGMTGWEANVSFPSEITVLSALPQPPGSLNVGDSGAGDFIMGLPGCEGSGDQDILLVQYTLFITDAGVGPISFGATTPSSYPLPGMGWVDCLNELRNFHESNSPSILFTFEPAIDSVVDVPDDEGHWVRVNMDAPLGDAAGQITGYNLWREIPAALMEQVESEGVPSSKLEGFAAMEWDGRTFVSSKKVTNKLLTTFPPGNWEIVKNWFAMQQSSYTALAPTIVDNVASNFFVSVHTADPLVWYASTAQSGTSIDNLPPGVPKNISAGYSGTGTALSWDPADEEDFQYWKIYRSSTPGFTPTPGDLLFETATLGYNDPTANPWSLYYKISAVDHAGNEGPAGEPAALTAADPLPTKTLLHEAVPNPFNPSTTIAFELSKPGRVQLNIYSMAGRLVTTLVDGDRPAGHHEIRWNGRGSDGSGVASGVYIYRLESGERTFTRRMTLLK